VEGSKHGSSPGPNADFEGTGEEDFLNTTQLGSAGKKLSAAGVFGVVISVVIVLAISSVAI
jgi:hypothetical protein